MEKLEPGIYKIRKRDYVTPFGAKHVRQSMNGHAVHLLRVTGVGDTLRYFIDHNPVGQHPSEINEDYEVLSKYEGQPQVGNCIITIKFSDAAGERFEFSVRDAWSLRNIFDSMSWLKKPFGYVPRKNGRGR